MTINECAANEVYGKIVVELGFKADNLFQMAKF